MVFHVLSEVDGATGCSYDIQQKLPVNGSFASSTFLSPVISRTHQTIVFVDRSLFKFWDL